MSRRIGNIVLSVGCFLLVVATVDKFINGHLPACNSKQVEQVLKEALSSEITSVDGKHFIARNTVTVDNGDKDLRLCSGTLSFIDKEGYEVRRNFDYTVSWENETRKNIKVDFVK